MDLPRNYTQLTSAERRETREEYITAQYGNCYYCKTPLSGPAAEEVRAKPVKKNLFPKHFFKWPVHLHHSHDTGMTIGAVHCYCNAVLWQYEGE